MVVLNVGLDTRPPSLRPECKKAILRPNRRSGREPRRQMETPAVTVSILPRRLVGVALATFIMTLPAALAAQSPTPQELSRISASGSYLAARHASSQRDSTAASAYYRAALKADPRNPELLERAFLAVLADGDIEEAVKLAERVLQGNKA
jgi:hypothetical protein